MAGAAGSGQQANTHSLSRRDAAPLPPQRRLTRRRGVLRQARQGAAIWVQPAQGQAASTAGVRMVLRGFQE